MSEPVRYIQIESVRSGLEVLTSSIYGDLGDDDPVDSMYGYPGFDEVSVVIFIFPSEIKCWMSQNFLELNESKSEILLFGPLIPPSPSITVRHSIK